MNDFRNLKKSDRELYRLVEFELSRQDETIDLIASENFAPSPVLELLGSALTNKYSEGYPGRRYYPGNEYYDKIERLARARARKAFRLSPRTWSVNVQPYSGSPANLEIYSALMKPGEKLMGMSLTSGGHLTHGHRANFSGQWWRAVQYGVDAKTGLIDYGALERLARLHRPKVIVSGVTAYPRVVDFKQFGAIAKRVGAYHVADISHIAGLVASGLHPSPFPYSDVVMTTTHKTLRGPRGAVIFSRTNRLLKKIDASTRSASTLSIAEWVDRAVFPGMQGGPHNNIIAAIAATFGEALRPQFKKYQRQVLLNAKALASSLAVRDFTVVTGGTDNHMVLVDMKKSTGIDGLAAERRLERAGIIANRNTIPGDTSAFRPSGIRLGTPAVTSRGMDEQDMVLIAGLIRATLRREKPARHIREAVRQLALKQRRG